MRSSARRCCATSRCPWRRAGKLANSKTCGTAPCCPAAPQVLPSPSPLPGDGEQSVAAAMRGKHDPGGAAAALWQRFVRTSIAPVARCWSARTVRVEHILVTRHLQRPARQMLRVRKRGYLVADCESVTEVAEHVDLATLVPEQRS